MGFSTYADLARNPVVRRILVLGLLMRIPLWAGAVVLTLHVVSHLDRSYTQAGLIEMVYSIGLAVSGPWRGRRLDRIGLRATVGPSLVVLAATWSIAPWVTYWVLLGFVALAGLFVVPTFSIVRQVLIDAVPDAQRTAVLSIDSVVVEFSFMVGPVLGVLAATYLATPVALLVCQLTAVAGALFVWVDNPPLKRVTAVTGDAPRSHRLREWLTAAVLMVFALSIAASVILTGEDLGTVAALRSMHHTTSIGWVLAVWGSGSAFGAIVYGALRRHPPSAVLLILLGTSTAIVSLAGGRLTFTLLLLISGLFCAPTMTATIDELTRLVPVEVRGEAMGWHGSAITFGGAAGAPLVGAAIDHAGWQGGFQLAGLLGGSIALLVLAVRALHRHRSPAPAVGEASSVPGVS
ncbi:MAG TPA: MFS transporter [Marmoricola sp.]|nr:MFS transporter [Marmoricola sp.]